MAVYGVLETLPFFGRRAEDKKELKIGEKKKTILWTP